MNETMSLLLATTVLAIGGVGLYMYKSDESDQVGGDDYNEDTLFGSTDEINDDDNIDADYISPNLKRVSVKQKTKGSTKRYFFFWKICQLQFRMLLMMY